jgi:hypothetical protein
MLPKLKHLLHQPVYFTKLIWHYDPVLFIEIILFLYFNTKLLLPRYLIPILSRAIRRVVGHDRLSISTSPRAFG